MQRYLLSLAYDGAQFYGWQKQPSVRTVQREIERALSEIAKMSITTIGSSRTDTGVHALSQFVHFDFPIKMSPNQLKLAVTTKLPKDIKILNAFVVDDDFSSRYMAVGRSYKYYITDELTPFNRNYRASFPRYRVYETIISENIALILGAHNFEHFSQKNPEIPNMVCNVSEVSFDRENDGFVFAIKADRFLHNMVRRIVGTYVKVSSLAVEGKLKSVFPESYTPSDILIQIITTLLDGKKDFLHLVFKAPPHGLYLTKVHYPEDNFQ